MLQQKLASFSGDLTRSVSMFWRIHPGLSLLNLVLFIFQGILPVGYLWALKKFIDVILKEGGFNWSTCGVWLGAFAGLQLLTLVIGQVSGYFQQKQQQVIGDDLSMRVLGKAIRLDVDVYENPSFNDALLMVQQQTLYKPVQIIGTLQQLLQQIITVASLSVFLFSLHWSVPFLLVLLSLPLAGSKLLHGYQQFVLDKTILPLQRKSNELYRYLTSDGYAKEVRVFGYGTYFIKKFTSLRQFITNKKNELEYRFLRKDLAIQFFEILVISLFYVILLGRATAGAISIGGLVIYFQVLQRVQSGINSVFRSCISVFQQQLYLREVQEYLAMETEPETAAAQLSGGEGLEINQVSFSYPRTGRLVLDNVSLRAKPGQLIAIVGENGSGKSTLMKLICGLYKAAHGTVTIMGNNAATLSTESRSKLVTAVFQDFGKYYLTLAENIAIGDQEPEEAQLKRALYLAEGSGLLAAAPSGFQSQLGRTYKNGWQLSGGQWQKVAIARAVYRNTPLLVLDEPTSAVDPSAEYEIFQQLRRMLGTERMMVLITHRLYNLRIADCIYVMENGKLVEQGNFEELVQARGHFYALYQKQQA